MLKAVNDALALSEMWVQLIVFFDGYANWSIKELKKKIIKETGIARCTDLLNDQT